MPDMLCRKCHDVWHSPWRKRSNWGNYTGGEATPSSRRLLPPRHKEFNPQAAQANLLLARLGGLIEAIRASMVPGLEDK